MNNVNCFLHRAPPSPLAHFHDTQCRGCANSNLLPTNPIENFKQLHLPFLQKDFITLV